ncbi:hypothetical protein B6U91_01505 [Candidatus Pacearchaeota archaeon ex4484_71]|nr:MAG: hypothetical protein B6U91_01505 [Candidatus Pacearchaeota archaeon ex4484_71]
MITYKDIYEAAKKERYSESLQPISKSFFREVAKYLKDKREAAAKDDDVFSDSLLKTKKQLENAVTLFQELLRRRRKKILNLVLIASETGISRKDFENMLQVEKDLFEKLVESIEESDKQLNMVINGDKDVEKDMKNMLIVFLEHVEELTDLEGEKIGPFEEGQIANIPKEIAEILISEGKVQKV